MGDAFNKREDDGGGHHPLKRDRSQGRVKSPHLSKGFGYVLVRIPIKSEDVVKVRKLLVNDVIITNAKGHQGEGS